MRRPLPVTGADWDDLKPPLVDYAAGDVRWRDGKTAVYVFNAGLEIERVQKDAYVLFMSENGLGPMAFPSLKRMEEEVVGFGLELLHAPDEAPGAITAGGADSITMALKTARDFARKTKGLAGPFNIVLPRSAHPAFDKAAAMMEIEVRRTPVKVFLADATMAQAADESTVMIVGSAPCFPYGLIDPIGALSELALARDLWLHVDACVGGYIAPFVRMNGADIAPFDFELPGVRSISADLHEYGYYAKGASTVFFRLGELQRFMGFDVSEWPGGRMVTPTLAGTRPGGAISAAWAVMNVLGVEGYRAKQGLVTATRERIEAGVRAVGFEVIGRPQLGIVAFHHPRASGLALWSIAAPARLVHQPDDRAGRPAPDAFAVPRDRSGHLSRRPRLGARERGRRGGADGRRGALFLSPGRITSARQSSLRMISINTQPEFRCYVFATRRDSRLLSAQAPEGPREGVMSATPEWLHGGGPEAELVDGPTVSIVGVIAWIAAIVVIADVLFLAQRFLG